VRLPALMARQSARLITNPPIARKSAGMYFTYKLLTQASKRCLNVCLTFCNYLAGKSGSDIGHIWFLNSTITYSAAADEGEVAAGAALSLSLFLSLSLSLSVSLLPLLSLSLSPPFQRLLHIPLSLSLSFWLFLRAAEKMYNVAGDSATK
jgi:hypothetical protein